MHEPSDTLLIVDQFDAEIARGRAIEAAIIGLRDYLTEEMIDAVRRLHSEHVDRLKGIRDQLDALRKE